MMELGDNKYVLGENIYLKRIVNLKLKLERCRENDTMLFLGIVKGVVVPPNNESYAWPGSYGWGLGSNGGAVWKEGLFTKFDNTLVNPTE